MYRKLFFIVSVVLVGLISGVSAMELKVDIGCPGQEAGGYLKEGWVAFDGTACTGAVPGVAVANIGGSGIDVAITTGNPLDNAYRTQGDDGIEMYTGDELGRDYVSADDSNSLAECTMTMTLSNLPAEHYALTTYHNRPDYADDSMPIPPAVIGVTVSGSGVVGNPINASGVAQTYLSVDVLFDDIGKSTVEFDTDGAGEVVVTLAAEELGHKWRVYLNAFELISAAVAQDCLCLGDLNDDDQIDLEDLQALAGILLEAGSPFVVEVEAGHCGNMNDDLQIDLEDLQAVAGILLDAGTPFISTCGGWGPF